MRIVLWIVLGLLLLGILFLLVPAIIVFVVIFRGKRHEDFDERDTGGTVYEPYRELLSEGVRYFKAQKMQDVSVKSFDGKTLRGKYLDGGFPKTAILIHGYRSSPFSSFGVLGRFLYEEKGFNLLFTDSRATGESEGRYVGLGLLERFDVRSWARFISKKPEVREILIAGVSMGATSVALTADHLNGPKMRGVIFDCGFECPKDQLLHMSEAYKPLPGQLLLPLIEWFARVFLRIDLNENTVRHLNRMQIPALFIHGEADDTVPFYEGENAYRECGSEKMRYFVEGAGHATAFYTNLEEGKQAVSSFLDRYFDRQSYEKEEDFYE